MVTFLLANISLRTVSKALQIFEIQLVIPESKLASFVKWKHSLVITFIL